MIKRILRVSLAAAAAVASLPAGAAAQQPFGPSAEASFGASLGGGGDFVGRGGAGFDAVLALPVAGSSAGTVVLGLTGAMNGKMTSELVCEVRPGDVCAPEYPVFFSLGAVAGVQRALGSGVSARAVAGPAYFQAVDGDDVFGLQGRVDLAKSLGFHTALVVALRGAVLPSYQEESLHFTSFGLGLRIQ